MVGIRIENVSKAFGDTLAVDGVSVDVKKGELFFLLGPSGCGKTTILRMIAGFETPTGGDILFDGQSILPVPAHKRNTGLVFQNYALWPHMTVEQNVAYGLDERRIPRGEKQERVARALSTVHMDGYEKRMSNQLSGGQQQRVALARAMVIEPDVVLLDEPLSNLDARLRVQMRDEIRRIHDETGITMVYVTHDQKEALSMADNIAVMSMGKVEQVGPPRTVYRRPRNRFVADFIGETNLLPGTLVSQGEGEGRVETKLGTFSAALERGTVGNGDSVTCMIRPECLGFEKEGPGQNRFDATMRNAVYLGEVEQFVLDAQGILIRAVCSNPGKRTPAPGDTVTMSFASEDAVVLEGA